MKVISDVARISRSIADYDLYTAIARGMQHITEKNLAMRTMYPDVEIDTCKRDIESDVKRITLHPDLTFVACADFRGDFGGATCELAVGLLSLPCGLSGRPCLK